MTTAVKLPLILYSLSPPIILYSGLTDVQRGKIFAMSFPTNFHNSPPFHFINKSPERAGPPEERPYWATRREPKGEAALDDTASTKLAGTVQRSQAEEPPLCHVFPWNREKADNTKKR